MKKQSNVTSRILILVRNYVVMFLLISFAVTCSILLFLSQMTITFEQIEQTAKATFGNIFLITAIICVIEGIVRFIFTELPMRKLTDATQRLTMGDFSVRIKQPRFASRDTKRLIDAFNTMAEELSGLETLRTDFISNVSHEIKTPLSAIQNYSSLLSSADLPETDRIEYAEKISESSKRLSLLVTNILKLNKLENQKIFPPRERFNLSEQICECVLEFESIWENKSISLRTDIDDDIYIDSYPELLSLVWNNLLSNAFKFTDEGGSVSVSLKNNIEGIVFSVSDTGCGMSPKTGAHIFEKFYQGDTSHSTLGNGLGLPLVKRVIDIVGATVSVQSTLGVGSTFKVTL